MVINWLGGKYPYVGEDFPFLGKKRKVLAIYRRKKQVLLSK
jgi:hypothetical protein